MNIREAIRNRVNRIVPAPSSAWEEYVQSIRNGKEDGVPVYGRGNEVIFDYYGLNKKSHVKQGRVRIPLWGKKLEISYHITQTPDGSFHPIYEGIFPYSD